MPPKEVNLVCMSGQGSVQTVELMAQAYFAQYGKYVASRVFPGGRCKSGPTISYLKVNDKPIQATSANYNATELVVFWDGLFNVSAHDYHPIVADAIGRVRTGIIIVNTRRAPEELELPFQFEGTLATVDADSIVTRLLRRDPPPVGICLMGAYARVTGQLDMVLLAEVIERRFHGELGRKNLQAAREAYETVRILPNYVSSSTRVREEPPAVDPDILPGWSPIRKMHQPGMSEGGPTVYRTRVPVCDDNVCQCKGICLSEVLCPDNTGFIVRNDGPHGQGYRIDVDYCRGCGICANVCVFGALKMVPEDEERKRDPRLDAIALPPQAMQPHGSATPKR